MDKGEWIAYLLCIGITTLGFSFDSRAWAQTDEASPKVQVQYLSTSEAKSKNIRDILGRRSLSLVKPSCDSSRQRQTRGLQLVSKSVALEIHFATNKAAPLSPSFQTLDELGKALTSDAFKSNRFLIGGHTDNVGKPAYNCALSERRAQGVVQYLIDHFGINKEQLLPIGYGMNQPLVNNDTDEGRQKNRRVQIGNLGRRPSAD